MRSAILMTLKINVMVLLFVTYILVSWYRRCGDIHCQVYRPAGTPVPARLHYKPEVCCSLLETASDTYSNKTSNHVGITKCDAV